jgi:glycosyltransferase involved in cell wall biosynthesis
MKRILLLEPYYGGSHKQFLTGIQDCVEAEFVLFSLPARKWKMRMQFSAVYFVQQIKALPVAEQQFDLVLCSTFVDVAVLRSLLLSLPHWNRDAHVKTYFHENQIAYPGQQEDISMRQFISINYTTALASDSCAFNSHYNLDTFVGGVRRIAKFASDMKITKSADDILGKSVVLHPGMDYSFIDTLPPLRKTSGPPVIVWNHRWEHDKGPEEFFAALYVLQEKNVCFRLIVLGESYASMPDCFTVAKKKLQNEIIHFGYAASRKRYGELLSQGDIVISTAKHEFFGISVLEAVRAGAYPLLPESLSYPELYPKKYLYSAGTLVQRLEKLIRSAACLTEEESKELTERFAWHQLQHNYTKWLLGTM